jgi:hypothetical protein
MSRTGGAHEVLNAEMLRRSICDAKNTGLLTAGGGGLIAQPWARRPRSDDGYERSSEVNNMRVTLQGKNRSQPHKRSDQTRL